MTPRISGIPPDTAPAPIRAVLEAQTRRWGVPLGNHLVYARRPSLFRAVRGMWAGLEESGLLEPPLVAVLNRRVAALNGCEF